MQQLEITTDYVAITNIFIEVWYVYNNLLIDNLFYNKIFTDN